MFEPIPWMTGTMWWLTAGCGAIALVVCWFAVFFRRVTSPRCPKCRYDMRAASTLTCAECGHEARTALALRRRRPWNSLVILAMLIVASVPVLRAVMWSKDRGWSPPLSSWKVVSRVELPNGTVAKAMEQRNRYAVGRQVMIVEPNGGETIVEDIHISVSSPGDCNGDGVNDLIVEGYSGGAHCCTTFHVFAATHDGVEKVAELFAENGGVFEDLDGDGDLEYRTSDATWNYSISCYACLHHPKVIMRFNGDAYVLAPDLMRSDPPTDFDFAHIVAALAATAEDFTVRRDEIFSAMIRLTYEGHLDRAHMLLDRAWNDEWGDRAETLALFTDTLESSPYWPQLHSMQQAGLDRLAGTEGQ